MNLDMPHDPLSPDITSSTIASGLDIFEHERSNLRLTSWRTWRAMPAGPADAVPDERLRYCGPYF
jgi:hypothetical protein